MGLFCPVYLDLNLFQTEAVYVLSVLETAEVNLFFFFSKLARISERKCLKKKNERERQVSQEDNHWVGNSFLCLGEVKKW